MSDHVVAKAVPIDSAKKSQMAEVVAPATLGEGYTFLADVNGRTVSVVVPAGGVKEGQKFLMPIQMPSAPEAAEGTPLVTPSCADNVADFSSPRGYWKDGLCDCCAFGPCHPSLLNAIFCPQLLMAQVLTRMNMSWLGQLHSPDAPKTFYRILALLIAYWAIGSILAPPPSKIEIEGDDMNPQIIAVDAHVPFLQDLLYRLINMAFGLYSLIVLIRLRRAVRDRYAIPAQTCCDDNLEDCCCAFFCGCCTVSQLARHTADYQERRALCCSTTGLPPSAATNTVMVV